MAKRKIRRSALREKGHKAPKFDSNLAGEPLKDTDPETTDVKPFIYDLRLFQPRVELFRMSKEDILATREQFTPSEITHHLDEIPEACFDVKLEDDDESDQEMDSSWESDGEGGYYKHSVKVEEESSESDFDRESKSKSKTYKKTTRFRQYLGLKRRCPICKKMVTGLTHHLKTHDPEKAVFKCKECPKKYFVPGQLRKHILQRHSSPTQRPFKCTSCGKRFSTKYVMEVHERIHGEPAFSCYICERKFQQEGNLKKHLDKRHSGDRDPSLELVQFEKAVKCALCPKEFKYFPGFINHVFRDHGDNSEELSPRTCSLCSSITLDSGLALLEHIFKQHMATDLLNCGKCSRKESLPSEIEKHLKEEHKVSKELCKICGIRCYHVAIHEQIHYPEKASYECEYCDRKFLRKYVCNNHIHNVHSEEFSHKCPVCGKGFKNNSNLKQHLITTHRDLNLKPYECSRCDKKFKLPKELTEHLQSHLNEPPGNDTINVIGRLTCGSCSSTSEPFDDFEGFLKHVFEAHPPVDGKIQCDKCGATAENGNHFLNHLLDEHTEEDFRLSCSNCDFMDKSLSVLERHLHMHHRVTKDICPTCGKRVTKINSHILTHSPELRQYECKVCGRKMASAKDLKRHEGTHAKVKSVSCHLCGKVYKEKGMLRLHMIKCHDVLTINPRQRLVPVIRKKVRERQPCPVCNKMIINMDAHMVKHDPEGEKFHCSDCPKKFFRMTQLQIHTQHMHTGLRKFSCSYFECDKSFLTRPVRDRHELTHSNERNCICPICDHKCHREGSMKEHMKNKHTGKKDPSMELVHLEGSVKCPLCPREFEYFEGIKNHIFRDHGGHKDEMSPRTCPKCKKDLENGLELLEHLFKQHVESKLLKCGKCDRKETLPSKMETHLKKEHKVPNQMCRFCGIRANQVNLHEKRHYPENANFKCEKCGRSFFCYAHIVRHMETKHTEEAHHKCPTCGNAFKLPQQLRTHMSKVHEGLTPYECSRCEEKFKSNPELSEHRKSHKEERSDESVNVIGKLKCVLCERTKTFKDFEVFTKHVFEEHVPSSGKVSKCEKCDQRMDNGRDLLSHLIADHMEDKCVLSCINCDFTETSVLQLEEHMSTRHNMHRRMCKICGKRLVNMSNHLLVHADSTKCNECGEEFATVKELRSHENSHEQTLKCTLCGIKLGSQSALVKHMRRWHMEK